jgi:cysteine desulfurase
MKPVYLDYAATTPVDPRVLESMLPFFSERFGNPASRHHGYGGEAAEAVERARAEVAALLGADPREIVFTSGATEANNLAILGTAAARAYAGRREGVVTVATEHRSVLDPVEALAAAGRPVTVVGVEADGLVDLERLAAAITERTLLVSVMHANNEIGVLQPIAEIGALCKARGALLHTDATQSFGKEPIDVEAMGIDLLSASAHKIYGPKGVGVLYMRRRNPHVRVEPRQHGGGHERGARSGTLNVPGIVGMGAAAAISAREMAAEGERLRTLRDRLESVIGSEGATVNGRRERRLAALTNLSFEGLDGEELMRRTPEVAVSSASACTSAALQPSYVLAALGLAEESVRGSVRFSLGRPTTSEQIDVAAAAVVQTVRRLRQTARR